MCVEYITMLDDYNLESKKGVPKKLFREIKNNMVFSLCVEKICVDSRPVKCLDIIKTQPQWKLI